MATRGLDGAPACFSGGDESGERGRGRRRGGGKVREGDADVSWALFGVLGRPGSPWASRWRPRRARPLQRAALARREEDDRRVRGLGCRNGKLGPGGPGKWATFLFFFFFLFSLVTFVLFS